MASTPIERAGTRPGGTPSRLAPREAEQPEAQNVPAQTGSTPTPTQHENDQFALAQMAGTLPQHGVKHAQDGSPIDQSSHDPTPVSSPTWP